MAGQQQNSNPTDLTNTMARMRERDRLAQDRQQLSNDLSRLEKNMRDSARQLAPNQPGTAKQLRDALTEMDNSDLDNHTQRERGLAAARHQSQRQRNRSPDRAGLGQAEAAIAAGPAGNE